jgi:hypothetical protein
MEKPQVVLGLLVPANQQTSKPIHPGMRPLNDPPARFEASDVLDRFGLFSTRTHMRRKIKLFQDSIHLVIVVACIQAHPLGSLLVWLGSLDDQAFDRWAGQFHVMSIGTLNHQANRDAMSLSQ